MAQDLNRGEIWLYTFAEPDKRRPVLIVTRQALLKLRLHQVTVAPITSTLRGDPSEVALGVDEGLKGPSAVSLMNVQTVARAALKHYVGSVGPEKMRAVCAALRVATGCD